VCIVCHTIPPFSFFLVVRMTSSLPLSPIAAPFFFFFNKELQFELGLHTCRTGVHGADALLVL
jgi:hypothetical protein